MKKCPLPNYRFQKVIETKIKQLAWRDLGLDQPNKQAR